MKRTDYHPAWLDRLADDVVLDGSVMNGSVRGAEAVRTILGHARTLYEYQLAGTPYREHFLTAGDTEPAAAAAPAAGKG